MVILQISVTNEHSGDMRACDRILRGIERMEESGYIVERYDHYSPKLGHAKKIIMAVTRTDEANDAEFEKWLYSILSGATKKPAGSGQETEESKTPC